MMDGTILDPELRAEFEASGFGVVPILTLSGCAFTGCTTFL